MSQSADDPVTQWLAGAVGGDPVAQQELWQHCFEQLRRVAHQRLTARARRTGDGEDVALSAMNSFFDRAREGRFPQLDDRHDLWKILTTLTIRKVNERNKREGRQKRGGGEVRGESLFGGPEKARDGLAQLAVEITTPEIAATFNDELHTRLEQLGDVTLARIACWKMEGYSHSEIADNLQCTVRTVERKLERIRNLWSRVESP
jgi:DNA-directed RNA polymerase specialized sigma24 family protein